MTTYHDKDNDIKYFLGEEKIRIDKVYSSMEVSYADIENINLGHNYRTYDRKYHCKIKVGGIVYIIKYREDSSLWAIMFRQKRKGQKQSDYRTFVNILHQQLKKYNNKVTYTQGNQFSFILFLIILLVITILMLFSSSGVFLLGFINIIIAINVFINFPTKYDSNKYKHLIP